MRHLVMVSAQVEHLLRKKPFQPKDRVGGVMNVQMVSVFLTASHLAFPFGARTNLSPHPLPVTRPEINIAVDPLAEGHGRLFHATAVG